MSGSPERAQGRALELDLVAAGLLHQPWVGLGLEDAQQPGLHRRAGPLVRRVRGEVGLAIGGSVIRCQYLPKTRLITYAIVCIFERVYIRIFT